MPALRIGVDGTCLASGRGYARFLREMLPFLLDDPAGHEYTLFLDRSSLERVVPPAVRTVVVETRTGQAASASARSNRSLPDLWAMGRAVAREHLDVMYFPSVYSYFPVPSRVPVAVAFHDTIAERWGAVVFPTRRTRWLWRAKVALARAQASGVLTVSEWSRTRLHEELGIPRERIHVTPEAPAPIFRPVEGPGRLEAWLGSRGLPRSAPYFLYVGGFNPHKNLARLVEAFARIAPEGGTDAPRLILVGDFSGDLFYADIAALRERIARSSLEDRVAFPGFVPDEELRDLYAGALAVVLPSLEEGFGLPAVEGAACGAPCIATRNSPLPALLEGGGLFVDPLDVDGLETAMKRVLLEEGLRERLARRACSKAGALSWRAGAEATRRALEATAEGRR